MDKARTKSEASQTIRNVCECGQEKVLFVFLQLAAFTITERRRIVYNVIVAKMGFGCVLLYIINKAFILRFGLVILRSTNSSRKLLSVPFFSAAATVDKRHFAVFSRKNWLSYHPAKCGSLLK